MNFNNDFNIYLSIIYSYNRMNTMLLRMVYNIIYQIYGNTLYWAILMIGVNIITLKNIFLHT